LFRLTCRVKGSVVPSALVIAIPSSLLAVLLVALRESFEVFRSHSEVPLFPSTAWTVLAMPLSLLIAFRTSQAYQRFWEGSGLLHAMRGEWFDSASCLATFSLPAKSHCPEEVREFRHTMLRLMSLCHGSALDEIKAAETEGYEVLDLWGLDEGTINILRDCKDQHFNRVEVILHMVQVLVISAQQRGVIDIPAPILSRVYQTLSRGFVNLLSAKKIKDTRFPFPYAQMISVFLLIFAVLTPCVLATMIESKVWCPVFTFVPVFALLSLNYTAGQLEMPFGDDANDLPLDKFQSEMNSSLFMLMHDCSDHVPSIRSTALSDIFTLKQRQPIKRVCNKSRISMFVKAQEDDLESSACAYLDLSSQFEGEDESDGKVHHPVAEPQRTEPHMRQSLPQAPQQPELPEPRFRVEQQQLLEALKQQQLQQQQPEQPLGLSPQGGSARGPPEEQLPPLASVVQREEQLQLNGQWSPLQQPGRRASELGGNVQQQRNRYHLADLVAPLAFSARAAGAPKAPAAEPPPREAPGRDASSSRPGLPAAAAHPGSPAAAPWSLPRGRSAWTRNSTNTAWQAGPEGLPAGPDRPSMASGSPAARSPGEGSGGVPV